MTFFPSAARTVPVFEPSGVKTVRFFSFSRLRFGTGLNSTIATSLHLLLETGTRVILPPPFLCCGLPAHVNAKSDQYSSIVLRNTVLFSQIREMFSYLDFDACAVTCGTCLKGSMPLKPESFSAEGSSTPRLMLSRKGSCCRSRGRYLWPALHATIPLGVRSRYYRQTRRIRIRQGCCALLFRGRNPRVIEA